MLQSHILRKTVLLILSRFHFYIFNKNLVKRGNEKVKKIEKIDRKGLTHIRNRR